MQQNVQHILVWLKNEWNILPKYLHVITLLLVITHVLTALALPHLGGDYSGTQDPLEYRRIAKHLIYEQTFSIADPALNNPDIYRGPGYPLFLAMFLSFDDTATLAILAQQALLALSAILIYFIARILTINNIMSGITSLVVFSEPYQWMLSLQTMTETLFTTLFLISSASTLAILFPDRIPFTWTRPWIWMSFALGCMVLVKPTALIFVPVFFIPLIFMRTWAQGIIGTTIVILILTPLLLRNYILTGDLLLSTTPYYNYVAYLGTQEEYSAITGNTITHDADGRAFYIIHGFTLQGYANLIHIYTNMKKRVPVITTIDDQIMCAPIVMFHSYSVPFNMLTGKKFEQIGLTVNRIGYVGMSVIYFFVLLGLVFTWKQGKSGTIFAVICALLFILITIPNVCGGYSRMLIPFQGILLVLATLGFIRSFRMRFFAGT